MKLKVLGCHGGELLRCKSTCFLIDETLALDAGALTSTLSLEELRRIDHVLLTHSHFDHIKDLPMMADLIVGDLFEGTRKAPVVVHSSSECDRTLRKNMFNDALWPDFTKLPTKKRPVLKLRKFKAGSTFKLGRYSVKSVPVDHPVESCAFIISDGNTAMAISGDTGPTDALWKALNKVKNLKLLLIETSFPNELQKLADASGHLTPRTLASELEKFDRGDCQVLLYHLKPSFVNQLKTELSSMPVQILELGDEFEF